MKHTCYCIALKCIIIREPESLLYLHKTSIRCAERKALSLSDNVVPFSCMIAPDGLSVIVIMLERVTSDSEVTIYLVISA